MADMLGCGAGATHEKDAGLIRCVEVTTANKHDASEFEVFLLDALSDNYGDSTYQGDRPGEDTCSRLSAIP